MSPALDTLTEDHAAVYDRQLRVWGVEVQRRLMEAKVLIIGLGGLAAEVAKNIVLAGVGTVALVDDTPASAAAPGNFLVEPCTASASASASAENSRSVAEVSAATLQAMNPLVSVRVEPGPPSAAALLAATGAPAPDDNDLAPPRPESSMAAQAEAEALRSLVSRYDTVVSCGLALREVAALDELCRLYGKQLFAGSVRGASSFVFADLGPKHTYTVKGEIGEKVVEYGTFQDAMKADLSTVNKRTHPLYLVVRGESKLPGAVLLGAVRVCMSCWEFEKEHSRPAAGLGDAAAVQAIAQRLAEAAAAAKAGAGAGAAAATAALPEGLVEGFVLDGGRGREGAVAPGAAVEAMEAEAEATPLGELAPVCAVVGGVMANNLLRAVSQVNPPLRNLFFYSFFVRDGLGVEEYF
ncbi:hypothetical protein VOLCADRAFT_95199 [Volvox carteri f. nagariensis]|uniref:THIF-type NAD/FAD binding fold domain-containing protein n=1 Tax=Volvox carteri f. nagariensis TaxID=3068 RepID=D8U6V8_VOLCA|nr:uncharacterized protein VOLCADRAFT_95199 [Volvox carteri f. nagariensis]EFJ44580.1 hypothetical protein VOLCADRAFT_95199 [Volvox carteri f. nagariensis]|eukprot:XP_002954430.1 hypothetical protein VOLCADRAFT_95199 [Volvox carteri f. nagariensis]